MSSYVYLSRRSKPFRAGTKRKASALVRKVWASKRPRYGKSTFTKHVGATASVCKMQLPTTLVPASCTKVLRYAEGPLTLAPGALGVLNAYVFRANSLYDPNETGVGHQPMGFDDLMTKYKHYCVTNARITVNARSADASGVYRWGIAVCPTNTPPSSASDATEQGNGVQGMITQAQYSTGSTGQLTLDQNISKFFGVRSVTSEKDFFGTSASNPAEEVHFCVWIETDTAYQGNGVVFNVVIDYQAKFSERALMAQS